MASRQFLHLFFLVSLLLTSPHFSLSQPQISLPPSLPPTSSLSTLISSPPAPTPDLSISSPPAPTPDLSISSPPSSSPPAPSPSGDDDVPDEAPAPAPLSASESVPVPVPAPSHAAMKSSTVDSTEQADNTEKRGLNSVGKAGVVVGVFAATALVGLGVLVCKRRQENIRRSRYGYSSNVELI